MVSGKCDTWDYQWTFKIVENNGFCITAAKPLISNIGANGGLNYNSNSKDPRLNKKLCELKKIIHPQKVAFNKKLIKKIYIECFNIDIFVFYYFLF